MGHAQTHRMTVAVNRQVTRQWCRYTRLFVVAVLALLLSACGGSRAPVQEHSVKKGSTTSQRSSQARKYSRGTNAPYTVARGDTLYAIAWRYGYDYRELATRNSISAPYVIYPGQTLYLTEQAKRKSRSSSSKKTTSPSARKPKRSSSTKRSTTVSKRPSKKTTKRSKTASSKASNAKTTTKQAKKTTASTVASVYDRDYKIAAWRRPAKGKLVGRFSAQRRNGILIANALGTRVVAAAAGRVVYAGSGLIGYGKLIILKHSKRYLSAYAHNNQIRVTEGDVVQAGQHIADMGRSSVGKVQLHFEIRRDGKPVDPLRYLPD